MNSYKLPLRTASVEFTEKKSRFIGHIARVSSEDEAVAFLHSIRAQHGEANHNVYAYRLKDGGTCRHSDDGEPSGTAGIPLLDVFLKQDIYDFCCVATRYFGGVMLGAGGLVRAYSRCGSAALEAAGVGIMREMTICSATLPYALYESAKRLFNSCGAAIVAESFGADVELSISLPTEDVPALQCNFTELTSGTVDLHITGVQMSAGEIDA